MKLAIAAASKTEPITIIIQCDHHLAKITGYQCTAAVLHTYQPFGLFFHYWLCSHPEVMIHFPPGQLAFSLNGRRPLLTQALADGDHIEFWGMPSRPETLQ